MTTTRQSKKLAKLAILGVGFLFSSQAMFGTVSNKPTASTTPVADNSTIFKDTQKLATDSNQATAENWMSFGFLF